MRRHLSGILLTHFSGRHYVQSSLECGPGSVRTGRNGQLGFVGHNTDQIFWNNHSCLFPIQNLPNFLLSNVFGHCHYRGPSWTCSLARSTQSGVLFKSHSLFLPMSGSRCCQCFHVFPTFLYLPVYNKYTQIDLMLNNNNNKRLQRRTYTLLGVFIF